jgi:uncharacterized protein YuzE
MKVEHDPRHDTAYVTFAAGASARKVALGGVRVVAVRRAPAEADDRDWHAIAMD